jgi:sirohydrochlorin cobaltochelatase
MSNIESVVLVGHGGLPADCPSDVVSRLKRLEMDRRRRGVPASEEENELDRKVRDWPRTPESDPYKVGLEKLAAHLADKMPDTKIVAAYNEFCAPSIEDAVDNLVASGVKSISLISSMFTPGGSHSDKEIPEDVAELRKKYPDVNFQYAWPFDLNNIAELMAGHLEDFNNSNS